MQKTHLSTGAHLFERLLDRESGALYSGVHGFIALCAKKERGAAHPLCSRRVVPPVGFCGRLSLRDV